MKSTLQVAEPRHRDGEILEDFEYLDLTVPEANMTDGFFMSQKILIF